MKNILILITILFVLVPVSSMASRGGGGLSFENYLFWDADKNRSQQLDRDEAKYVYNLAEAEIFARFDEDSNGLINRSEYMEFIQLKPWTGKFERHKYK